MARRQAIDRRRLLAGVASIAGAAVAPRASAAEAPLRFALTPVLLTSDLAVLEELKAYLAAAMDRPVHLVTRRTYQEITGLLVSRQVDAAWICGYPFVASRDELALVAVPVWKGRPLYQSYLICGAELKAERLSDLAGTVHAFSDPDSNSGYLVTCAALAEMGSSPARFFRQFFYTYGHRNVVRAVSAGLAAGGSVDGYVYDILRQTERRARTTGARHTPARRVQRPAARIVRWYRGQDAIGSGNGRVSFRRLTLTVRVPLIVTLFMIAVSTFASERVLTHLIDTQTRQVQALVDVYLDGLAPALVDSIIREDVWQVFDILDRSQHRGGEIQPVETVVAGMDDFVIAPSNPVAVPSQVKVPERYIEALPKDQKIAIAADAERAYVRREALYENLRVGSIDAALDIAPLLAERRSVFWTLILTNAVLTLVWPALPGWSSGA